VCELATKSEALNELLVTLVGLTVEVIKKLATLSYHREESATAGEVFFVLTHVVSEMNDALGEKCNLEFGTTGVFIVKAVVLWVDFSLCAHNSISVPDQLLAGRPLCGRRELSRKIKLCKSYPAQI